MNIYIYKNDTETNKQTKKSRKNLSVFKIEYDIQKKTRMRHKKNEKF